MHIIDIDKYTELSDGLSFTKTVNKKRKKTNKIHFLLVSVAIHLLLFLIVILLKPSDRIHSQETSSSPLKSYLIVRQAVKPEVLLTPERVEIEPSPIKVPQELEQKEQVREIKSPAPASEFVNTEPTQDKNRQNKDSTSVLVTRESVPSTRSIRQAIRQYTQSVHDFEVNEISKEAVVEYRKSLVSPNIDTSIKMSQEDREALLRKIEVDCSNAGKKGLSAVIGMFGGTIQCRDHSNFQEYIDKHLKK